ncbi:SpoIIE family protein phosphatase [Streptomyces sp. NPDC012765]|uniref:SpoIIE family protein phosphatase n=1 Tax=Streptomyces sp. NPDC012765 TaxID=3155249 RepID=UPI0033E8F6CA
MGTPVTLPFAAPTAYIRIDHYSAVHLAAETARTAAKACGLSGALPDRAAVVASELASNVVKHATDGALYIQPLPLGGGLEILAADHGPGMPQLQRCLTDGYSTTSTLGAGLGAVKRIATSFAIETHPGTGTLACARLALPGDLQAARQETGLVCLPADKEAQSGDTAAVLETGTVRTAAVIDGLGHGPEAAEAARSALRSFHAAADAPLPDILTAMHRALRHSRGAAVGITRLYADRAEYCGIGNVRLVTLSHQQVHHRVSGRPGVVGWRMPAPSVRRLHLPPGTAILMHTDGIDPRCSHTPSDFTLRLPVPLLAAAIAHRYRRFHDDATVLTARPRREASCT